MTKIAFLGLLVAGSIAFAPASFGETAVRLPTYKKTNVNFGDGVFVPVLQVKSPEGEISYIKIGEQGLTRTILFDNDQILDFGRKLNNKIRRAAEVRAENLDAKRAENLAAKRAEKVAANRAKRLAERKAQLQKNSSAAP